jgi:hypothetical protein
MQNIIDETNKTSGDIHDNMSYYDFKKNWNLFIPTLSHPNFLSVKKFLLRHILTQKIPNEETGYDDTFYRWDMNFARDINSLQSEDEKLELIDRYAWGKFSPCEKITDRTSSEYIDDLLEELKDWEFVSGDNFNDSNLLEHYFLYHECYALSLLIYTLCKLTFPEKSWIICEGSGHVWVMERDNHEIIYDFLYQYVSNASIEDFHLDRKVRRFGHPFDFYAQLMIGGDVDDIKISNELLFEKIERSWEYEDTIEFKKSFEWDEWKQENVIDTIKKYIPPVYDETTDYQPYDEI